jgi:hypothetical protein
MNVPEIDAGNPCDILRNGRARQHQVACAVGVGYWRRVPYAAPVDLGFIRGRRDSLASESGCVALARLVFEGGYLSDKN